MLEQKPLSESAKWFLEDLQKTLNNYSVSLGIQFTVINTEGELVSETPPIPKACQMIMATREGRMRCVDHFKSALAFFKNPLSKFKDKDEPIFSECYAGFASVWVPIVIKDRMLGVIIGCGGRYDTGESREKLEKEVLKLINDIGIMDREGFLREALDEVKTVSKEEMEERVENTKELFDILAKSAITPIKEIFG